MLAGVHVGCFELFASNSIRGFADLRGKSIGAAFGSSAQVFLGAVAAGIGLDPVRDIRWVTDPKAKPGIKKTPLVELTGTEPRRGAVEHFYRLTDTALIDPEGQREKEKGEADAA